ncbi:MAG TPA: hypothetical protein VL400_26850, partial [Polyangiaceae bacterium]|nr:hypothetical protein [Polyangiaceae bacterium]
MEDEGDGLREEVGDRDLLAGARADLVEVIEHFACPQPDRAVDGRIVGGAPRADRDAAKRGEVLLFSQLEVGHGRSIYRPARRARYWQRPSWQV